MRVSHSHFTVLLIVALGTFWAPGQSSAQTTTGVAVKDARGAARGSVVDQSAGVLPGVTVTATTADGKSLDTTVTNSSGEFTFDRLPAGIVALTFHLDGFEDSRTTVTIPAGSAAERLVQKLNLPAHSEIVTVLGDPSPPPPPPRPVLVAVPDHDPAAVCGPAEADGPVPAFGTIRSRQDEKTQGFFSAGDELLVEGGSQSGLNIGQNFIVRRRYQTTLTTRKGVIVEGEHSSGLLQIVSVEPQSSTAVVVYACDEMMAGDYLVPFTPDPIRAMDPVGMPAFDNAARILFADAGQMVGAPRRMMVIDRGTEHGLLPGQRLTLFRRSRFNGAKPAVVGEGVVVAARKNSATVRVEQATDVIFFGDGGDFAAPERPGARAQK
jgi:hypothetical protein